MKSQYLSLNGIRHHLVSWGNPRKPLVVFLHGWMDMAASFDFVCQNLQKKYHCVALDWRGCGKSAHTENPLGYYFFEYAADLHALLEKLSPKKPVKLVAHSMGGNVACFYAGSLPQRISHLVNIEGFGIANTPPEEAPKRMANWLTSRTPHRFRVYKTLPEVAQRINTTYPRLNPKRALFLAKHMSRKVKGGFQIAADPRHKWPSPLLYRLDAVFAFWKNITAKTLNIIAKETEMAKWLKNPPDLHKEIERRLALFPAGSRSAMIENSGHMVHHEQPEELARLIGEFLGE